MKSHLLYILPLSLALTACVENQETGEMEPSWLFWVFLGLIGFGLIWGAFSFIKKPGANDVDESKSEEQIKKYEETLEHKEEILKQEDQQEEEK